MSRSGPLVSVIIPAYNAGRLIDETLDSVLAQTYSNYEIIVVDDGSTDDTSARLARYGSTIRCLKQRNGGVVRARNTGFAASAGEYIAFLDQDDLWLPAKLEVQLDVASRHPASGLIVCDGVEFDGDRILLPRLLCGPTADRLDSAPDGEIEVEHFYRELLKYNGIYSCPAQTLIPRHALERVGPSTNVLGDHHGCDARLARTFSVTLHRHPLVRWRFSSTSGSGPADRREFTWAVFRLTVLRDEIEQCADGDREFVRNLLHDTLCEIVDQAYAYGRQHDRAYARSYLRKLAGLMPLKARPALALLALSLPEGLVTPAFNAYRALRRA